MARLASSVDSAPAGFSGSAASTGTATSTDACGAEGQRACTIFERIPSCNTDLVEQNGMCVHPDCGRENGRVCGFFERAFNPCDVGLTSVPGAPNDICIRPTPCGGKGQRACLFTERLPSCDAGLVEVPGCTGDCYSSLDGGHKSAAMCTKISEAIAEPTTNATPITGAACPLYGYMDMHLHLFADQAHGGGVLAGRPYDPVGGVNTALGQDYGTNLDLVDSKGNELVPPNCPAYLPDCGSTKLHGAHIFDDAIGALGTKDGAESNFGAPIFSGWPKWTSTTHQQSYYKWLERAWQGGLRLTTMLAVSNEALCKGSKHLRGTDCEDSMAAIDMQLDESWLFQTFIDDQHGGPGQGWFRIVTTPLQARQVIASGKLAVVLGIEVDNLFNCKFEDPECTQAFVEAKVDEYYNKGVRHVFPVHNFDNAFGAPATWQDAIEVGNRLVEGHWWSVLDCGSNGYGFSLGSFTQFFITLFKFLDVIPEIAIRDGTPSCNARGMFPMGEILLRKLMAKGMIIDVDHMSNRAFDRTLTIAETFRTSSPYPVVASHELSFDLHEQEIRHERMRTRAQLERIRDGGGMIAVMLKDDVQDTDRKGQKKTIDYAQATVANDCRHSSKSFAQAIEYAVDVMGGPVAFGSDFNGVAGHFGPRFGSDGCGGFPHGDGIDPFPVEVPDRRAERTKQYQAGNRLSYPFTLNGFGTFNKQVTGHKTFDYNVDGLAHIGLLPDMMADLKQVGLPAHDLNMLFRSAEAYIRLWENARGETPPANAPACAAISGINVFPQPVYSKSTLFFSPSGVYQSAGMSISWDFGDGGTGIGALATHIYQTPGTYTVKARVTDTLLGGFVEHVETLVVTDLNDSPSGPRLAIGAPAQTIEGETVVVNFAYAAVPWVLNQNAASCGSTGQRVSLQQTNVINSEFRAEYEMRCFYPGGPARTETISLTVFVPLVGPTITKTQQIHVHNRPPKIHASSISVPWGEPAQLPVVIDDAPGETLSLNVSWAPGVNPSFSTGPGNVIVAHTYAHPSPAGQPYPVTVTVTDNDGASATANVTVEVVGLPPDLTLSGPTRVTVGDVARYTIETSDPDGGFVNVALAECGSAGQLVQPPALNATFIDCHFTSAAGTNPVTVTVVDDDGRSAIQTHGVQIGVPPAGLLDGPASVPEGSEFQYFVQGYTTDGDNVTLESLSCGAGTLISQTEDLFVGANLNLEVRFVCAFPDGPTTTTVTGVVRDLDGLRTVTKSVTVVNLPPTLQVEFPQTVVEQGQPSGISIQMGDPGLDEVTAVIEWGDQTTTTVEGDNVNPPVTVPHVWNSPGTYRIVVTATDSDGASTSRFADVVVADTIAPEVSLTAAAVVVEATSGAGAPVPFTVMAVDNIDGTIQPTCTIAGGVPVSSGATLPLGETEITCAATDAAGNTGSASMLVTVVDTTPPALVVPASIVAEATSPAGAIVPFAATATDIVDGSVSVSCTPASGATFALGQTTVSCATADARGNGAASSFTVTVQDSTPPAIAALTLPNDGVIWPPNGRMVPMTVSADVSDAVSTATCEITEVASSEPSATLGRNAGPDWEITGPLSVNLRADRAGNGPGRTYTLTVRCSDSAGNVSTGSVSATVPHDQRR